MKNILFALVSLFGFSVFADVCHTQMITVGGKQIEGFRIEDTPSDVPRAKTQMVVAGIYQFIPKKVLTEQDVKDQNYWYVRRCPKANTELPEYDPNNCTIVNSFDKSALIVGKLKINNIIKAQRLVVTNREEGTLSVTLPGVEDEYHVKFLPNEISTASLYNKSNSKKCSYERKSSSDSSNSSSKLGSSGQKAPATK